MTVPSHYVVFPRPGVVELAAERLPAPGPGEVLCRAVLSVISPGTELACLRGDFDPGTNWAAWVTYPFRPGYSMVAEVASVGVEVEGLVPGQRVQAFAPHAQCFLARPSALVALPEAVPDAAAVWAPLAVTAAAGIERAGALLGERVGVVGLGPVGQLVVEWLRVAGVDRLIGLDPDELRLARAARRGATHVIASTADAGLRRVLELTDDRGLDVVFEVTGNPAVLAASVPLLRPGGRLVLLGDTPTPSRQPLGPGVVSNALTILGAHADHLGEDPDTTARRRRALIERFLRLVAGGVIVVEDLIGERASPREAPKLYEQLRGATAATGGVPAFDWRLA